MEMLKSENVFTFKFLDYKNEIRNYCINKEEDNCILLPISHDYVHLAKKMNIGDISMIYDTRIQLLYIGQNVLNQNELSCLKDGLIDLLNGYLKGYKYLGFFHETSIKNIDSIYKNNGILSRHLINNNNILIDDIAEHEVLNKTKDKFFDCARFYLRPKTPAHYKFKNVDTCIFVCDYDIIKNEDDIYMTEKIATAPQHIYDLNNIDDINYIIDNFNFKAIYNTAYVDPSELRDYKSAEFLKENMVELKYLKAIIFRHQSDKLEFRNNYPNWNIEVICDSSYFGRGENNDFFF